MGRARQTTTTATAIKPSAVPVYQYYESVLMYTLSLENILMASSISDSLRSSWVRREHMLRVSALTGRDSSSFTRAWWPEVADRDV